MASTLSFDRLRSILVATVTHLPDSRTRPNRIYEMADAALGAFAVFFVQSPSFLAHQRDMQRVRGQNNAASLFGLEQAPNAGQIRNLLVAPLLVASGEHRVIALEPEFVCPQDGHDKQDCELRVAERWRCRNASRCPVGSLTLLGDDLPKVSSAVL